MVTNIRERNDLSCDVSKNQSESLNAKLRRKTNYRANKLEVFYHTQEEGNRQAFIGEGDFEVSDFFSRFTTLLNYYHRATEESGK